MSDEDDFNFSEVQLEFQSQPDEEGTQKEMTQQTDFETDGHLDLDNDEQSQTETDDFPTSLGATSLAMSSSAAETEDDLTDSTVAEDDTDANFEDNLEQYEFDELPDYACAYCGVHSKESVAQCCDCEKWFCNSRGKTTGAHIINHLVRAQHKRIALHKDTPLGQTTLECFNCGGRNVFLLGFIPAKAESIVVLLCREPCLTMNSLKEMNWDLTQWVPLIKDRILLTWLVQEPTEREQKRALEVNAEQARRLEEMWKKGHGAATVRDVDRAALLDQVESVRVRYEDAEVYNRIYRPLILLEAEEERQTLEAQSQKGVQVRWEASSCGRVVFYYRLNALRERDARITPGDELRITYPGDVLTPLWRGKGGVVKTTLDDELMVEIFPSAVAPPLSQTLGFNIDFVWRAVPYNRMNQAIAAFATDDFSVTGYLYHVLLGHQVAPQTLEALAPPAPGAVPGLPPLNGSQDAAVRASLELPVSLVQGPPGTGKTVTCAAIVHRLARSGRGQVLVCAPSNIAVDQLAAKLHATGLKVVRMASRTRESVPSDVGFLYLHELVAGLAERANDDLAKLLRLREMQGLLSRADESRLQRLRGLSERELLCSAEVVCTTCVGAGDMRLASSKFKTVVVDESTQATEPEVFIPLVHGARQLVLVGDHCQLGPVILSKKGEQAGMQRSLFERLIMLGHRPVRLQTQYRMHPCLSEFPSNTFYEGSLQNGVTVAQRRQKPGITFEWPDPARPMFFYASFGLEELSASGTSYLNRVEAVNVEKLVTQMLKSGITPDQIGVITPYEGQRQYVLSTMLRTGVLNKSLYEELEVKNVDAFQGREKDYIILSCVRSNDSQGIGFLSDPRRLNVAITRARYGLVILGNPAVLSKHPLWHSLLMHFKLKHLIVEGDLNALTEYMARLPDASARFERRRIYAEEDDEFVRQKMTGGAGIAAGAVLPDALPTQYAYVDHAVLPGRLEGTARRPARPPAAAREPPRGGLAMSLEGESFEQSLDGGYEWQLSDEATQPGAAWQSLADDGEFTQHLPSQGGALQSFPESQVEREFEELSLGGRSQEAATSDDD